MQPANRFVQVKERSDLKVASDVIQLVNAPDVFTPAHCAVVEVIDAELRTGFLPGELVVVAAGELSAFLMEAGQQVIVLPARAIQARYERAGTLIPQGRRLIVKRDQATMQRLVMGEKSRLILPDRVAGGLSASGAKDPTANGRAQDIQTALYCPIIARGPKALAQFIVGDIVAFSPTVDVADITVRGQQYFVVDSRDVFGGWPNA